MINLKLDKKDKEDVSIIMEDTPDYPYGTCLELYDEQILALGLNDMDIIGEKVYIKALAYVKHSSVSAGENETRRSLSLQITDMEVERKTEEKEKKDISQVIYGE